MKRKERHHLKGNELASMLGNVQVALHSRSSQIRAIALAVAIAALALVVVMLWRQSVNARADQLLADAMVTFNARVIPVSADPAEPGEVPAAASIGATGSYATQSAKLNAALPKLQTAAETYPDSRAGITARYHYAASLAALNRFDEAIRAFDEVIQRAGGNSLYRRMARLGKADAQARAGQLEAALASWKELASAADDALPKDAILMELGRAYQAAGNAEEARETFNQIIDDFPMSSYSAEARAALGS